MSRRAARVRWSRRAVLLGAVLCCAACGGIRPVEPWQKGYLARPEMGFEGDRLDQAYTEHIYYSKEAASGSGGVAGGGCGCN